MESGGSERQMLQLLHGLDRDAVIPSLYLTYAHGPLLEKIPQDVVVESFAKRYSKAYAILPGSLYLSQLRRLRGMLKRRKISVTYDRLYHTVMLTAAAARGLGTKRVVTVVSPPSRDFGKSRQRWMAIKRCILGWSYQSADQLLAVSEQSADDASAYYHIDRRRWKIIPSPIDFESITQQANEAPTAALSHHDGLQIAMVGRLSQEKNHRMIFNVVAKLVAHKHDVHLHIVGDGILRQQLEQLVNELRLRECCTFYGVLANPHAVVARCDVMVLPSLYEGFPNVVMEAMAIGTPVLASESAGGLSELMGNQLRGKLLPPDSPDAWFECLANFSPTAPTIQQQIAAASHFVRENHNLQKWIKQMESIFVHTANSIS